ncbi:hypothetical protein MXB_481 [Myxobolus squamalis]|nr:hypothetical protein MXB_481 [Myxobolus squamalis]
MEINFDGIEDDINAEAWQEPCWIVISSFFEEKGLVRQQLDSFDEFIQMSIQKIVEEAPIIELESQPQHLTEDDCDVTKYTVEMGQIYLSRPSYWEEDGTPKPLMPNEARIRDLTYNAPLLLDIKKTVIDGRGRSTEFNYPKTFFGKIPIMLRSSYCHLYGCTDEELYSYRECPLDPGGYFIVNGSEKVLIAQEKMATNTVHKFGVALSILVGQYHHSRLQW